jgi:hypothetical protein
MNAYKYSEEANLSCEFHIICLCSLLPNTVRSHLLMRIYEIRQIRIDKAKFVNYYDDAIAAEATLSEPAVQRRRVIMSSRFCLFWRS